MRTIDINSSVDCHSVATIGFFDGVHAGHRHLLSDLVLSGYERGLNTMVVTFDNHPSLLFNPQSDIRFLTTCAEKLRLIEGQGVDSCLLLDFTRQLAALTSTQFMHLLHNRFGVDLLLVGYDHHFGSDLSSEFEDYRREGERIGVEVRRSEVFRVSDINVSSSKVRKALMAGDIELAGDLLGYPYRLTGRVVEGHHIGRTIGFPTANIDLPERKLIPKRGVYSAETEVAGHRFRAMVNIGVRPTFANGEPSVEVYIDGFHGDLYGRELEVRLLRRVREERKFDSAEALRAQIERDLEQIRTIE